jgi:hypothetical protein
MPTRTINEEIATLQATLDELKEAQRAKDNYVFVSVQFAGVVREYTYHTRYKKVAMNDYMAVNSPITNRMEIVKVKHIIHGRINYVTKECWPIQWRYLPDNENWAQVQ